MRRALPLLFLLACGPTTTTLFDGHSLQPWYLLGDGSFKADDGCILAESTSGKANSFLVTRQSFADFRLTLELKNELPGNSGIQIRSRVVGDVTPTSYAAGYQIEIDPSPRAWSGGLYDERGRGWLQSLEHDETARKAFRLGEWNRYRIECVGPWIRAWVNDVPTTDYLDAESLEGIIGLQVHSGSGTRIRFRDLQLTELGRHDWKALDAQSLTSGLRLQTDFGLRLTPSTPLVGWRLLFQCAERTELPKGTGLLQEFERGRAIDLGNEKLMKGKHITVLVQANRIALFRDGELVFESRALAPAKGPWAWIEGAESTEPGTFPPAALLATER